MALERVDHSATPQHGGPASRLGTQVSVERGPRRIQSVSRALDVLEVLAQAGSELSLSEISARTGLNISTCHHILATLADRGYVGQQPRDRSYYLGNRILELSSSRIRQFNILDMALPELRRLNQITRESVHLAVMQGLDLTTLAQLDSLEAIRVGPSTRGKTNAAHATATGKAILAWLPETEVARVIAEKGLNRFTDHTMTSIADLVEDLRHVRRKGFSFDNEEFEPGVVCVGAAIRDHAGAVIGSLSCSTPKLRADKHHLDRITKAVQDTATSLSGKLGSPLPDPSAGFDGDDS
ncbi:MAG: IclR family transcriptional regulator [Pseudomonadota bacterium]